MAAVVRLRENSHLPVVRLRENSHLPADGWSNWEKAMVPLHFEGIDIRHRGANQVGFICSSIRNAFPDKAQQCGIYEWGAKGTLPDQPSYVVYLGSTCRDQPALRGRINEYCNNGSHKKDLMNSALRRGYVLWVRVKIVEGDNPRRKDAEKMEKALLATYNYAWNVRNNGEERDILPRPQLQ